MKIKHSKLDTTEFVLPVSKRLYYREYKRRQRERWKLEGRKEKYKNNPHYASEYFKSLRKCVMEFYSGGKFECACCGELEERFLSIDHINGGGHKHRKTIKCNLYWWLIKNKFPDGYQVLCHNCNMAKGLYGKCPHQLTKPK